MNAKRFVTASWAIVVLAVAAAAGHGQEAGLQSRVSDMNGGLRAQVFSLGVNTEGPRPVLSATVKITNTGQDHVFLFFMGAPSAVDDNGVKFDRFLSLDGAAYCDVQPARLCAGIPTDQRAYPLNGYTEIDPGKSITVIISLTTFTHISKGDHFSLAGEIGYRLVGDTSKDVELSDKQKLKQVHIGNFSFERLSVQ
jgi:hypothetical protein